MTTKALDLVESFHKMEARRSEWDTWWQALGDVFLPNQADFTQRNSRGKKRDYRNFENSHRVAARNFAAVLGSFIGPQDESQLTIVPEDDSLSERDDVRLWSDIVRRRMWAAMSQAKARYGQAKPETDMSLTVFGTGVLFIGENATRDGLLFRSHHLRSVGIGENASGDVERLGFTRELTARQAAREYGEESLGEKTRDALGKETRGGVETKFKFLHLILPRDDRDARSLLAQNMPFASVVVDVDSEHVVRESGFHEFPFAVPRWETSAGEIYGRSPAMLAYSDAKTLQAIARTLLLGGQRAVDPPTWMINDAAVSAVRLYPGGTTVFDSQSAQAMGGRPPIGVLEMGTNIPLGRDMQGDYRELVQSSFFRDLFASAVDRPNMTATEILERKDELVRVLGPTFGRLEADYVGRIVSRVFNIMERAGAIPERPEAIQGAGIEFTYQSPFQQARRSTEAVGISRSLEMLLPLAQVDPSILDHYDRDAIARDTPEWFGFAQKYIRALKEVEEVRAQRAQQMQLAAAQQVASAAKDGGAAVKSLADAQNG